jgi:hypothetical protein
MSGDVRGARYRRTVAAATNPAELKLSYLRWSIQMYHMHEALARERIREQREQAARRRLVAEVASVRLWQRLAAYASRRAARSSRRLAEHSASDYSLAA